jgi:ABC-type uncharacterized transport system permease subunit
MILFTEILPTAPTWTGWVFALATCASALVHVAWALLRHKPPRLLWLAHALHAVALWAYFSLSPARFGFAAALSMTAWLVVSVYLIEQRLLPAMQTAYASERGRLAWLGAPAVLALAAFPGTALQGFGLAPPHLQAWTGLRPLHWALGLAAYGLLGAATLHAWLLVRTERRLRQPMPASATASNAPSDAPGLPVLTLERLMFRFVQIGFGLLSATWVVALSLSWQLGTWRWDHKAIFSLLAWGVLAGLLLGRARLGWRGRRAAHWVYAASACLLLAYAGSRFVLEVLLQRAPTA